MTARVGAESSKRLTAMGGEKDEAINLDRCDGALWVGADLYPARVEGDSDEE